LENTEISIHPHAKSTAMILIKPWDQAFDIAYPVRKAVFVLEQGVPEEMELDEFDPLAQHALSYEGPMCTGTARLVYLKDNSAQIGRMAVLSQYRGQGIGTAILEALLKLARSQGISSLSLHSQVKAIPFYEKRGFIAQGPVYEEAGIPHRNMILLLPKMV
jgi:predicted GNAT family N-acyltransferase